MKRQPIPFPSQLECGCVLYCDRCLDEKPLSSADLEFSRRLFDCFGEGWFDVRCWTAAEFSAISTGDESVERLNA